MEITAALIPIIPITTVTILALITKLIAQETIDRLLYRSLSEGEAEQQAFLQRDRAREINRQMAFISIRTASQDYSAEDRFDLSDVDADLMEEDIEEIEKEDFGLWIQAMERV